MSDNFKDKLGGLSRTYPPPSDQKLDRRVKRLQRMREFYDEKIPEAPDKQAAMFIGFVSALIYAQATIKMYRKLTIKLKEANDETRADS